MPHDDDIAILPRGNHRDGNRNIIFLAGDAYDTKTDDTIIEATTYRADS